ncbi:hypothetical protein [Vreelandella arctica]|uniref:hypothetical protein n=1 Tax=Vreelandella arctica TaxID=3126499 RepID=UPI00300DD302
MDTHTLLLVAAICALWMSITCGCIAIYLLLSRQGWTFAPSGATTPKRAAAPTPEAPILFNNEHASWEVTVLFKSPSPALNERLSLALASLDAVYEPSAKAYKVAGDSSRTPIQIENINVSGQLPSLTESSVELPPIKGVSIKITKSNQMLAPSKLQLAKLVSLSKKLARLGGTVVDAAQQPITKAGFQAVIAGNAKV